MRQIFNAYPWIHPEEPEALQDLYRRIGRYIRVRRGQPLKLGGDESKFFFLLKGLAAYYIAGDVCGHPTILSLLIPGRTLCDITAVSGERCNVLTQTLTDCELLQVPPERLREELQASPHLGELIRRNQIRKQESHLEGMVANFTLEPAARLKVFLKVLLLSHQREISPKWNEVPLLLSNEQYGSIVNLTRVSVSRIFSAWQAEGRLIKNNRSLQVRGCLFDDVYDWTSPDKAAQRPSWPHPQ